MADRERALRPIQRPFAARACVEQDFARDGTVGHKPVVPECRMISGAKPGGRDTLPQVEVVSRNDRPMEMDTRHVAPCIAWTDMKKRLVDADLHAGIELSTKTNRFGRYLRPATGLRIGTVVFFPIRTGEDGSTGARARSSVMESHARLSVEVDEYNTEVMSQIQSPSEASPPANLRRFLEMIAEG